MDSNPQNIVILVLVGLASIYVLGTLFSWLLKNLIMIILLFVILGGLGFFLLKKEGG